MTWKKVLLSFALVAALAAGGFTAVQAAAGSNGTSPMCNGEPCCGWCELGE